MIVALAIFGLLSLASLLGLYRSTSENARSSSTAFTEAVERALSSDIRSVAISLDSVASHIQQPGALTSPAITQQLERIEDEDPLIEQVTIIDSNGSAIDPSDILPSGETTFIDRRYYNHHRENADSDTFVDGPFEGRLMRRPYMTVSQRIDGPAGEFFGVIVAAVDLNAYGASLARLEIGLIDVIEVFHDDGTLMLRVPDPQLLAGTSFSRSPLFAEELVRQDAGVFLYDGATDGVARYVSFAKVGGFPLVVATSVPVANATAPWREVLLFDVLKALAMLAGLGAVTVVALHGLRRQAELETRYTDARERLQAAQTRHRSLFNALPANVALIGPQGQVLEVNADWSQHARREGSTFREQKDDTSYLAVCDAAAENGDEDAGQVAAALRAILAGSLQRFDLDYPCHSPSEQQWFHLTIAPIESGDARGAVAMHFDVTARKLAEIALSDERSRLRRLAEGLPGVVFQLAYGADGSVRWTYLSERSRGLFGLSPHDALDGGDFLANLLPAEHLPQVSAALLRHLRDGDDLSFEFPIRRPDGQIRSIHAVARAASGDEGHERLSDGIFLDVTAEREAIAKLSHLSSHDVLTGLLNRTEFLQRLARAFQEPRADRDGIAVHVIGVDDFGDICDAYGMEVGDAVLVSVAKRITEVAGPEVVVARISGERFAVLQREPRDVTAAATLAEMLLARIREPLDIPGQTITFTASIGIARPESRADTTSTIVTGAERALRQARTGGRGTFRFDEANSGLETQTRLALRSGLARAMANGEFVLHFQPRVRLQDGVVTGCEALLRWQHPVFGMQSPAKFIPVAEQSGQIVPIGKWVLEEACRQGRQWLDAGHSDLRIAVNISAVQVTQSDIVSTVETVLAETGLPASALELEMTEAVAFDQSLRGKLELIHDLGVSIAIDDFGTGFSSLGTLSSFPLDILKIDQSFVRKAPEIAADRVVVATVVDLARGLGLMTVAEGVETIEQAVLLQALGCDEIQGYYIAMPMEAADFRWFLETGRERVRRKLQPLYADAPQVIGGG